MAEHTTQEKTEKATPKRKRDARKKGQLPRSREVVSFILLLSSAGLLYLFGPLLYQRFYHILVQGFVLHQGQVVNIHFVQTKAQLLIKDSFLLFVPFFIIAMVSVYLGNILLSGHIFSIEKLKPELSNINPVKGLKKIFSFNGLSNLLQAILKMILVGVITGLIISSTHAKFLLFTMQPLSKAMYELGHDLVLTFLLLAISIITVALVDLSLQIYQNQKQLRMTRQELKDEMKQTEGRPEIKRKIHQLQRQAAKHSQMLQELSKASVVITNPVNFAVALYYEEDTSSAPTILAMGAGFVALNIQRISTENRVPVLQIPLLARALYYHGEIGQQIPEALFHAVAQVLAYIFRLDNPLNFHLDKAWVDQLPIPEQLARGQGRRDGRKQPRGTTTEA